MYQLLSKCVAFALTIALLSGCQQETPKKVKSVRPIKAIQVQSGTVIQGRQFPGVAKAVQEVNLAFDVNGTLSELPIDVGDILEKGQMVAKLDQRDFIARLNASKAELRKDQDNLARIEQLRKQDFASQAELDKAQAKVAVGKSQVNLDTKALQDTTLIAPFTGRVSEKFVDNFQAVRAKQQIARLIDISQVEMVIYIPERLISYAPYVEFMSVYFEAFPDKKVSARIKEISAEATLTTRTYPITIIMNQAEDFKILPGMAGYAVADKVNLPDNLKEVSGIIVPVTAIFTPQTEKQSYVWVIDPKTNTVSRRKVTTDKLTRQGISIISGLKVGEWVATAGVNNLEEGDQVEIIGQGKKP